VTRSLDFTVTIFLNVIYLENGTRYIYAYNDIIDRTSYMIYRMVSFSVTLNDL